MKIKSNVYNHCRSILKTSKNWTSLNHFSLHGIKTKYYFIPLEIRKCQVFPSMSQTELKKQLLLLKLIGKRCDHSKLPHFHDEKVAFVQYFRQWNLVFFLCQIFSFVALHLFIFASCYMGKFISFNRLFPALRILNWLVCSHKSSWY